MSRAVAIVEAARTPFCLRGGRLSSVPAPTLGALVARDVLLRSGLPGSEVELIVAGTARSRKGALLASEIAWEAGLRARGHTVSAGGISSEHALAAACDAITVGRCEVAIAVGVETPSELNVGLSQPLREAVTSTRLADTAAEKLRAWAGVRASDLRPEVAPVLDSVTQESIAAAAQSVALRMGIDRDVQDRLAVRSHARAIKAWQDEFIGPRVVVVPRPAGGGGLHKMDIVTRDDAPRPKADERQFAEELPLAARDATMGVPSSIATVTAANLARPVDGAAAVLLASPEFAAEHGLPIFATVEGVEFGRVDPFEEPLLGGVPTGQRLLSARECRLDDLSVVEMTETAAASTIATIRRLEGLAPRDVNQWGGALAYGRCAGADGLRMLIQAIDRLALEGGGQAAVFSSGEAGLGAAVLLRS